MPTKIRRRRTLLDEGLVGGDGSALLDGDALRDPRDEDELGAGRELVTRDVTEESEEALTWTITTSGNRRGKQHGKIC